MSPIARLFPTFPLGERDGSGAHVLRTRLVETPWGGLLLHRFLRDDPDANPHDHPWDFYTLMLRGGYVEELYREDRALLGSVRRRGFGYGRRLAQTVHRVVKVAPGTLTLVLHGPVKRRWGFFTPMGWIPWKTYLGRDAVDC